MAKKMFRIGIIGTGMLGKAVASNLLNCGYEVHVYNRTKKKTNDLVKNGANFQESPKDVAKHTELVITCVKDGNAVKEVIFGECGIVKGKHEGLTIADMSTINPNDAKWVSLKLENKKIDLLEIPVMGGPNVAIKGELVMMVSGKKSKYMKFKSIFDDIAKDNSFLGKSGTAHLIKLAMNLQISLLAVSLAEGIVFTKKAGFEPEIFLNVLNSTYFSTGMSKNKAFKMIYDGVKPTFMLKNLKKDLDTILTTAQMNHTNLPITKRVREIYNDAEKNGLGDIDYTGIIKHIRSLK